MCLCCMGPEVQPTTERGKTFKCVLVSMMIPQLIVAVLNFIAHEQFILEGIFGLFFLLLIYGVQHSCSYQCLMLYIFISIFFAITFLVYFLTPIQNQQDVGSLSTKQQYNYAVSIISFAYYLFSLIFCFYPYREFKGMAFDQNPALKNYFQGGQNVGEGQEGAPKDDPNVRNVDYDANYGNIQYDKNKRNNDHGTFEVFKGQGVQVG